MIIGCETQKEEAQGKDCLWYHVSHCYFARQRLQPTFLRLRLVRPSETGATFEPMFAVGHHGRRYWWQTLSEVASSICTEAPAADTLSIQFLAVTEDPRGHRRCPERVYGANLHAVDRAWHRGMALSEITEILEEQGNDEDNDMENDNRDIPEADMDLGDDSSDDDDENKPGEDGATALRPKCERKEGRTHEPDPGEAGVTAPTHDPPAAPPPQVDPMAEERVEKVKRAARGHREVLQGGPDGFAFGALFTHRKPGPKTPHGGYQATCYEHDAEQGGGHSARASLRCVKELPCEEEADDARVLSLLGEWVCSARGFATRREHMGSLGRAQSRQRLASEAGSDRSEAGSDRSRG